MKYLYNKTLVKEKPYRYIKNIRYFKPWPKILTTSELQKK